MDLAAKIMWEKKVCEESEGAVIVDLTKHSKKLGKAVIKKKDGTSLYLTRDIGAAMERVEKYHFEYDSFSLHISTVANSIVAA
jgi:arginyl-tRNA synthetase